MGFIAINGVEVFGRIGITAEERKIGRNFRIDVKIKYPLKKAGISDRMQDSFDYSIIANVIQNQFSKEFNLLESACRAIATEILTTDKSLEYIEIRMKKLSPFVAGNVESSEIVWIYPEDW